MNAHVSSILLGVRDTDRSKRGGSFADRDGHIWRLGYSAQGENQPYAE